MPLVLRGVRTSIKQLFGTSSLSVIHSTCSCLIFLFSLSLCSVCDGLLQGARQYHLWYYAPPDNGRPARTCHRRSCTREPRYGAPCTRGRPGRRPTDLGKQRKCGRRRARADEARHNVEIFTLASNLAEARPHLRRVRFLLIHSFSNNRLNTFFFDCL